MNFLEPRIFSIPIWILNVYLRGSNFSFISVVCKTTVLVVFARHSFTMMSHVHGYPSLLPNVH